MNMVVNSTPVEMSFRLKVGPSLEAAAAESGSDYATLKVRLEDSYIDAAKAEHGDQYDFVAEIDTEGYMRVAQYLTIVDIVKEETRELSLANAQKVFPNAKVGFRFFNEIEPVEPEGVVSTGTVQKVTVSNVSIQAA